jgi:hypothetical protein
MGQQGKCFDQTKNTVSKNVEKVVKNTTFGGDNA